MYFDTRSRTARSTLRCHVVVSHKDTICCVSEATTATAAAGKTNARDQGSGGITRTVESPRPVGKTKRRKLCNARPYCTVRESPNQLILALPIEFSYVRASTTWKKLYRDGPVCVQMGGNWPIPTLTPRSGCTEVTRGCHPKAWRMRMPFASHCTTPGIGLPSSIRSRIALASGDAPPGGMP